MGAGRRRAEKPRGAKRSASSIARLLLLCASVLASAVAWYVLVRAAIDFGQAARHGNDLAWAFTIAATLGATLCLLLLFVLCSRLWARLGLSSDGYRPRRSSGRRSR